MESSIIIGILTFYFLVLSISIYLKKKYRVHYDRKALLSGLMLILAVVAVYMFGDISELPGENIGRVGKISWLILITAIAIAITQFLFWLVYTVIRRLELGKMPRFLFNLMSFIVVLIITLYTAKHFFNLDLSGLLFTSTIISAIIGLSMQETLSNVFAGLSLQLEATFSIDDWVNLGGHEGKVANHSWRSLTLITRENHRIVLPNRVVAEEKIINYSRPSSRQIHTFNIDLDYSHPPNQVLEILRDQLNDIPEVEVDDIAYPFVVNYAESGITYCLKFWIDNYADVPHIQNVVLARLWYALDRNKIKIPYPIREILINTGTDESKIKAESEAKQDMLEKLRSQAWLSEMTDDQLQALAERAKISRYSMHDNLVTQDTKGDSMYMVVSGSTKVLIKGEADTEIHVADKNPGDFFGEMSLLTGDNTSATVRAKEDMEVIVVDKEGFTKLILDKAKILDKLFNALESNKSKLKDLLEEERLNSNTTTTSARQLLMARIKRYLDIE